MRWWRLNWANSQGKFEHGKQLQWPWISVFFPQTTQTCFWAVRGKKDGNSASFQRFWVIKFTGKIDPVSASLRHLIRVHFAKVCSSFQTGFAIEPQEGAWSVLNDFSEGKMSSDFCPSSTCLQHKSGSVWHQSRARPDDPLEPTETRPNDGAGKEVRL